MASSRIPPLGPDGLPQPDTRIAIDRTFQGFRMALARMSIDELIQMASTQAAALQAQADERLRSLLLTQPGSSSNLDQLVQRTTPTRSTPEPSPRGRAAQASPPSPPPDPLSRLSSPRGRALAAKLLAANARSVAHRRVR